MEGYRFADIIISWYQNNKRELPWRNTTNPYAIWLSEIILQQTRVAQGLPYYQKFINAYPTVRALAAAPEVEVLRLWQGLGYYSRARNLHACAKIIVQQYGGEFPENYLELLKLKGVGVYTAAAIASFAFNENVPVVDGNVYRVLSRVYGIHDDILSTIGQKKFRQLAQELVPAGRAHLYNQAIMEFGALQCTPANPACLLCPVNAQCYAFQYGLQKKLPVKIKKVKSKTRYLNYVVIRGEDELLMKQRVDKDIWSGLYDFYLIESKKDLNIDELAGKNDVLLSLIKQPRATVDVVGPYKHQLTHQRLFAKFIIITLPKIDIDQLSTDVNLKAYSFDDVRNLPKPILIDNFLNEQIF